uniref:Uncharacterized protein n=1 Tax=Ciona savignyi TaxID=51511 RepID=H2YDC9_CIOSA
MITNYFYSLISPQSTIVTSLIGLSPEAVGFFSISATTSIPDTTFPNTTCFPSNHGVFTVVMKNWDPFVSFPALAMLRYPGPSCFNLKFSSLNHELFDDAMEFASFVSKTLLTGGQRQEIRCGFRDSFTEKSDFDPSSFSIADCDVKKDFRRNFGLFFLSVCDVTKEQKHNCSDNQRGNREEFHVSLKQNKTTAHP